MMRGIVRFGPVVFTGPLILIASPTGSVAGNPVEISCAVRGQRAGIEIVGQECQLRRVQPQIVEDIGFRRIEHTESASHHGVPLHRPGEPDARRPIILVEFHAGVRDSILSIGCNHDGAIQVEVADPAVGGRSDVVAKPKIDGQVGTDTEIVLHKAAKIPITGGVEPFEEVLFVGIGDAEQQVGQSFAAVRGGEIVGVDAAEVEESPRRGDLVEVALLAAKIDAEFQRMPAPDPGQRVRDLDRCFQRHVRAGTSESPKEVNPAISILVSPVELGSVLRFALGIPS